VGVEKLSLFGSEGNAISSITVALSFGSFDGAASSGSSGKTWATVVLVVTSGHFVAFSLSDTARLSSLSPFAVNVTAMESSEPCSEITLFSSSNIENSVSTKRGVGKGSGSGP